MKLITVLEKFTNTYIDQNAPKPQKYETHFLCFHQFKFQTLTEELKNNLDSGLTIEDISQAIQNINTGKVPGPDGLPMEFYRTFHEILLTPLINMYDESYRNKTLPPLRLAMITLILKLGKPTECSSFRPICLIESDTKLLCKAPARRLDPYIPHLVHNDQNSFVQKRQGFHSIRRVPNIILEEFDVKHATVLSLDARQAFDRI